MDRYLLTFAFCLLALESFVLLGDLDLLPFSRSQWHQDSSVRRRIGEVTTTRQFVRRREFSSVIWEDSRAKDALYLHDSVLTLAGSGARLVLENNVKLDLHENTLVVLEPQDDLSDGLIRLRFSRGDMRARNEGKKFSVKTGEWTIEAKSGSDLSLRTLELGQVEIEVNQGAIRLNHELEKLEKNIEHGHRVILEADALRTMQALSASLKWKVTEDVKIYAHKFPVKVKLVWEGEAKTLRLLSPTRKETLLSIAPNTQDFELPLERGGYHISLSNDRETSRSRSIYILSAPQIVHLSPLPRERIKTLNPTIFSWFSESPLKAFRLELRTSELGEDVIQSASYLIPGGEFSIEKDGPFYWHIIGIDEDGFEVPPSYGYPIFSSPNPLEAPRLRAPAFSPDDASYKTDRRSTNLVQFLFSLLMPQAEAKALQGPKASQNPSLLLQWDPVDGADFYMIEISSSADFKDPEIIAKVFGTRYAWTKYQKKVYYYRVAAGTSSGRKGLFTRPERIDLGQLVFSRAKTNVTQMTAKALDITPPSPPSLSVSPALPLPPLEVATPSWSSSHADLILGAELILAQHEGTDRASGRFTGVQPLLGGGWTWQRAESRRLLDIELSARSWRPKSASRLAFQKVIRDYPLQAHFMTGHSQSPLSFGLWLGQWGLATRKDLEVLAFNQIWFFGAAFDYSHQVSQWSARHQLSLGLGSGLLLWQTSSRWLSPLFDHPKWRWGLDFNIRGAQGPDEAKLSEWGLKAITSYSF